MRSRRAILVHNPSAGAREHDAETVAQLVQRLGFEVKSYSSKKPGLEEKLARRWDLVVAAGGDGTIAKVAKFLAAQEEQPPPLAILPIGTANNIALSLGIGGTPQEIVEGWSMAKTAQLSLGRTKAHWGEQFFVEGVGMGPLAQATATKKKGDKSSAERIEDGRFAFRDAVREAKPERLYVTVDGERIEDEVLLVEALNIRQVGPRLCLAPRADPSDDLLEVVYLPSSRRKRMMAWVDALIEAGSDAVTLPKPPVSMIQGRNVVIAWNGMELRVDDAFPLMPGAVAPQSAGGRTDTRSKDRTDLLELQIAERKLTILATPKRGVRKANGPSDRSGPRRSPKKG